MTMDSETTTLLYKRFLQSSKTGDLESLQEFANKVNVEYKDELGNTALHWAASGGHLDIVRFLVEKCKANINAKNNVNDSPLHKAAWRGALSVVQYIVDKTDANTLEEKNKDDKKAVDLAHHLEVKSFLQSFEGVDDDDDDGEIIDDDDDDDEE